MSKTYFNVKIELDKIKVDEIIDNAIRNQGKGYVCSVERNVIATSFHNHEYCKIVNDALVNILDGSIVALFLRIALKRPVKTYIGADLFLDYVKRAKYRSYFLGNTPEVLKGLKNNLIKYDSNIADMKFETLPFMDVYSFDYKRIAQKINEDNSDIIWVSLGAPKQEIFMSKLLPHINRGVMFGFGAIFNFNSGIKNFRRAPSIFLKLKLEWLYRIIQEPKKNIKRNWEFLRITPQLIREQRNYIMTKR